jgi:hypothetical protein
MAWHKGWKISSTWKRERKSMAVIIFVDNTIRNLPRSLPGSWVRMYPPERSPNLWLCPYSIFNSCISRIPLLSLWMITAKEHVCA